MPRVGLTGDFAKLKRIQKKIEETPRLIPIINKNLADEVIELIKDGIDSRSDPYGKPYAPLVLRSGQPLNDSGGLKASWFRKLSTNGFTVESGKSYTIYHQLGTGIHGPKRKRITPLKKHGPITPSGKGPSAKALRIPMRGGKAIYAKSVAGSPQRKMVPDRGLPSRWRRRLIEASNEIIVSHFKK